MRKGNICKSDINEELKLIDGSSTDYITRNGNVFKYYSNGMFYKKSTHINKNNGYVYCGISIDDKAHNVGKRVHILVAKAFVDNPNELIIVGHKNNIKHDNRSDNLYWTTTQENTQKAIDDGLLVYKCGINSGDSQPIAVIEDGKIISVYGSMGEAQRYIKNITVSYLSKVIPKNGDYKPRSRKYIYKPISLDDFNAFDSKFKNIFLEDIIVPKKQSLFTATNIYTGEILTRDNQKAFAREFNLNQAMISHAIKNNSIYDKYKFELVMKVDYINSTAYTNFIDTLSDIHIESQKTKEIKIFPTFKDLKDHFGLRGNDIKQYYTNNQLILSEWKIVNLVQDELINKLF